MLESTLSLESALSGALGLALTTSRRGLGSNRSRGLSGLLNGSLGGGSSAGSLSSSRGRSSGSIGSRRRGGRSLSSGSVAGNGGSAARTGAGVGTLVVGAVTVASLASKVGSVVLTAAGPDLGAGSSVVGDGRVVDAEEQTGVGGGISTRERDNGRRLASTGTVDGELSAANVELSTVLLTSAVETNVLGAHEVSTLGSLLGKCEGEVGDAVGLAVHVVGPLNAVLTDSLPGHLVDLEPVTITKVVRSLSAVRGLAQVDSQRTGVAHVVGDSETNLIAGRNSVSLGSSADILVETASIADDVLGGDVGDGAVVVGSLADVLIRLGDLAIDDESVEVVVRKGSGEGGDEGQSGREGGSHLECCF